MAQNSLPVCPFKGMERSWCRYTPSDRLADLNLYEYKIGDMRFVPVAVELFKEVACFPADFKNRIFVLDP